MVKCGAIALVGYDLIGGVKVAVRPLGQRFFAACDHAEAREVSRVTIAFFLYMRRHPCKEGRWFLTGQAGNDCAVGMRFDWERKSRLVRLVGVVFSILVEARLWHGGFSEEKVFGGFDLVEVGVLRGRNAIFDWPVV